MRASPHALPRPARRRARPRSALALALALAAACGPSGPADAPPAGPPLRVERELIDVVALLDAGDPLVEVLASPEQRPLAAWSPRFDPGDRELASDRDRKVVRAAAGSAFRLHLDAVPARTRLLARTLVYSPHRKDPERADPWPVRFRVLADGEPLAELSSDYILEPGHPHPFDQLLRTLDLDLAPFAGAPLTLTFEVLPGPETPPPDAAVPETGWWELRLLRETEVPRQRADARRPNVLVVCVDTLAGGRTSLLGHGRPTTPALETLAARGTSFADAWAPSSWTLPSTASLLTGVAPNTHGVLGDDRSYLMESLATWPEQLRAVGIEGAAFVGNPLITEANNFHQGFGHWQTLSEVDGRQVDAHELTPRFLEWLDAQPAGARWFAYVHPMDPHAPYGAPGPARERFLEPGVEPRADLSGLLPRRLQEGSQPPLDAHDQHIVRDLYDGEVAWADRVLGELLDALAARDLHATTLVVFTADHGEELFEHGALGHGYALWEEMLRVPLVLAGPGVPAGRVVRGPVSTASLAATLQAVAELPPVPGQAPALLPLDDALTGAPVFAITRTHLFGPRRVLVAARDDAGHKVVLEYDEQGVERLGVRWYDLRSPEGEARDLAAAPARDTLAPGALDVFTDLTEAAHAWAERTARARPAEPRVLDAQAAEELDAALRELGYTGDER